MPQLTLPERGIESLFGTHDENLKRIEQAFEVQLAARGNRLQIEGDAESTPVVEHLFVQLGALLETGYQLKPVDVETSIRVVQESPQASLVDFFLADGVLAAVRRKVTPRSLNQQLYLRAMIDYDMVISIGPAGTGKTYLAVAMAAALLLEQQVKRIILARPAVEAGEQLGFLPGDLAEKVNPYLRPLYDALYDMIGFEKVGRMMERGMIEVAPHRLHARPHPERQLRDPRRGPEHHQRADEDVPDPDRLQLQGGDQRRRHPDRPAAGPHVGSRRGAAGAGRGGGHQVRRLQRARRGAPHAGAGDRPRLRPPRRAAPAGAPTGGNG